MYRWMTTVGVVVALALATACADDPTGGVRVDRVEVGPGNAVLAVGDSVELTAVPLTEAGDIVVAPILWRSLNPAAASIRVSGAVAVVEAKAPGTARIEAESGGRVGFVDVTIQAAPQVAAVDLLPTTMVLGIGQAVSIQAVARAADGQIVEGRATTWAAATDGTAAVVPETAPGWARVTGVAAGETIVRATIDGVTGEAMVQVVAAGPPPEEVVEVIIAPMNFSLPVNHETSLQAIAKTANGAVVTGLPVSWASTADSVATVTGIGISPFANVKAGVPGTATIRATVNGVVGEAAITVTPVAPPPQQAMYLFFQPMYRGIWVNQLIDFNQHLTAIGSSGSVPVPDVTWEVEDSTIAIVDEHGYVRGLKAGNTKLFARHGSIQAMATVAVFQPSGSSVTYDLLHQGWDRPPYGTETWTDENGEGYEATLWLVGGTLSMTSSGQYERVLKIEGWVHWNGYGRKVIERDVADAGTYTIIVGGESGYRLYSETTAGHSYEVLAAYDAGHLIMRDALGEGPEYDYLFRMRQ